MSLAEAVRQFKRQKIVEALIANKGNQCATADSLEVHRNILSRDCERLHINARHYLRPGFKRQYSNHPDMISADVRKAVRGESESQVRELFSLARRVKA